MTTGSDGIVVSAPIFRKFMDFALKNQTIEKFPEYDSNTFLDDNKDQDWMKKPLLNGQLDRTENLKVCQIPGSKNSYCLANKYCPDSETTKKTFVNVHDILYYVDRTDPLGKQPDKPENDPQYQKWEDGVQAWYKDNKDKKDVNANAPQDECKESDFSKFKPSISISVPNTAGQSFVINVKTSAPYGVDTLTVSMNGNQLYSGNNDSFSTTYDASGKNGSSVKIDATVKDNNGNTSSDEKGVSISWIQL